MKSKFTSEKAQKVWLAIVGHPFPIGTELVCKDKRYTTGYVTGIVERYYQDGLSKDPKRLDLSKPWCYEIQPLGSWRVWKSPKSVVEVLER